MSTTPDIAPEWQYLPAGWPQASATIKGWDEPSVAETQLSKWNSYVESLEGTGPLGVSHESPAGSGRENRWAHNLIMSYAYVFALAARRMNKMSMLDWGGGIGHYYPLSKTLIPDLELEYYCKDVPALAKVGRKLLPDVHFLESDDACFARQYDFVYAGSSVWCVEDWRSTLKSLSGATGGYIYITRMMFTNEVPSFVALQRPYAYGYQTEYPLWILNEADFVAAAESADLKLVRQFILGEGPPILDAPARGMFKGFLFRKA